MKRMRVVIIVSYKYIKLVWYCWSRALKLKKTSCLLISQNSRTHQYKCLKFIYSWKNDSKGRFKLRKIFLIILLFEYIGSFLRASSIINLLIIRLIRRKLSPDISFWELIFPNIIHDRLSHQNILSS
jgi:hypothetical protein